MLTGNRQGDYGSKSRKFFHHDSMFAIKKEPIDIKASRLKSGFTQQHLAWKLGLALSTVSKWEQGITFPGSLSLMSPSGMVEIPRLEAKRIFAK
jgi:DNA-binding transcriptional regulator YiaG